MKFFRIEHKTDFYEWVAAKDEKQAVQYLIDLSGKPETYTDVKVVEQEAAFGVNGYVDFYDWAATLTGPAYMGCSGDF